MGISINVLTGAGFKKVPLSLSHILNHKTRLYSFLTQTPDTIGNIEKALQQELNKGRTYEGDISRFNQDIQLKPYLFKQGKTFKLMAEQEALQLQKTFPYPINLKQDSLQEALSTKKEFDIPYDEEGSMPDQLMSLNLDENPDFLFPVENLINWVSSLGKGAIPERLLEALFQSVYAELPFINELEQLLEDSILQHHASSTPNFKCYQMDAKLQENFYNELSDQQQKDVCEMVWKEIVAQLNVLIKDEKCHEKGLSLYLGHCISFLNKESFKSTLSNSQKDKILFILNQLFDEESSTQKMAMRMNQALQTDLPIDENAYVKNQIFLYNILGAYDALGQYHKAVEFYEKYLMIAQELKYSAIEGPAYGNLGGAYKNLGKYHEAIKCFESCLRLAQDFKDHEMEGYSHSKLGGIYHILNEHDKAIDCYEKYLKVSQERGDRKHELVAYGHLGNAYYALGDSSKAGDCFTNGMKIALELEGVGLEVMDYSNLENIWDDTSNHPQAAECYENVLKIAQAINCREEEMKAYSGLGSTYHNLGEYHQAAKYYKESLKIAQELKNRLEEGETYNSLGISYQNLCEYSQAEDCHQKQLTIAQELGNVVMERNAYRHLETIHCALGRHHLALECCYNFVKIVHEHKDFTEEGKAYSRLGVIFHELGDYHQALKFSNFYLILTQELKDRKEEGLAHGILGMIYSSLGEYNQAMECHKKRLVIAQELKDLLLEGAVHSELGNTYYSLGEYRKAVESHKKRLVIAQELKDREGEVVAYCGLGGAYSALGEYIEAMEYYRKDAAISEELGNQLGAAKAYANLGSLYNALGMHYKAVEYHELYLEIVQELEDRAQEGIIYSSLGEDYADLGEHQKAVECYKKSLIIAQEFRDRVREGRAYYGLGNAYKALGEYAQAEECFSQSIKIAAFIQNETKESQWKVTLFENWSKTYIGLEKTLLLQNKIAEALEISDRRRSRALSSLVAKKLSLKENQEVGLDSLSCQKMQELAEKLRTTFIIYSLDSHIKKGESINAWIVSSKREITQLISLTFSQESALQLQQFFKNFPYKSEIKRPLRKDQVSSKPLIEKTSNQLFNENLASWYDLLITPLESYLPLPDSGKTLTFIPDGFLAHIPFGSLYNTKEDKYLIEQYPISISPSIQVLSLLDQLPKVSSQQVLLMGNPTTPKAIDNNLKYSEPEVREIIAPLMNLYDSKILTQKEATVENVFKHAPQARYIHFACHGVSEKKPLEDPHSVFEGHFQLAPDAEHPLGYLHAKEVNSLALKADLVFMSACHLGRGNLQKEGSIGPIWSFLGAGARSTIASYWPLVDGEITVKMVDTFYRHYLGIKTPKLDKAHALQQAVLMAMKTERKNPRQWGAFFLSGLTE